MKVNKKVLNGVLGVGVLGVVLIGGAFAYLTDSVEEAITVTIGDVEVELTQDNTLTGLEVVIPNETFAVNPSIKNIGTNDAVVFMEVIIPIIGDANIVQLSGLAQTDTSKIVALFDIKYPTNLNTSSTYDNTSNAYWEDIEVRVYGSNDAYLGDDVSVSGATTVGYVFGYNVKIGTDKVTNEKTENLFTNIKAANFTEKYVQSDPVDIPIKVYAIQAEYVDGSASQATSLTETISTSTIGTSGTINKAQLTQIFNTFVNQNNLNDLS